MSVVHRRQRACVSAKWTAVVLLVLCSTVFGIREEWIGGGSFVKDPDGSLYKLIPARLRRDVDDNDISQDTDTVPLKTGDANIISEKLSIYKVSDGDKSDEDVKLAFDSADLEPDDAKNAAGRQKLIYSYPYVVFRRIADGKKVAGNDDAVYKDGTSYLVSESRDYHPEKHDDDIPDTSNFIKVALAIANQMFPMSNGLNRKVDSNPWESKNLGTFRNGLFADYRNPAEQCWSPWRSEDPSELSEGVFNTDRLVDSMISNMLEAAMGRKPSRTSSVPAWWPSYRGDHLPATQTAMRLMSPELLWMVNIAPPIL